MVFDQPNVLSDCCPERRGVYFVFRFHGLMPPVELSLIDCAGKHNDGPSFHKPDTVPVVLVLVLPLLCDMRIRDLD